MFRVRYSTAAERLENVCPGLVDSTVGKLIEALLHHDLIVCNEVGFALLAAPAASAVSLRPSPEQGHYDACRPRRPEGGNAG